jgi:hypothetical protein
LVVGFKVKSGMLAGARGRFGKFLFLLGLSDVGEVLWKRLGGMRGMAAGAGGGIGEDVPQERGRGPQPEPPRLSGSRRSALRWNPKYSVSRLSSGKRSRPGAALYSACFTSGSYCLFTAAWQTNVNALARVELKKRQIMPCQTRPRSGSGGRAPPSFVRQPKATRGPVLKVDPPAAED